MRADLSGQVALVAGADTPLGAEIGRRLASSGAQLAAGTPKQARQRFGRLDMVVNCGPIVGTAPDPVTDAARLLRESAAEMQAQGAGRIVTIIGIGANVVRRNEGARSAAMAAIASLTRTAAMELGAAGVLVNAVAAGPGEDARDHIPTGRPPSPGAIANAAMFLLAPAASYITGHILVVDGGFSAGYVRNF